jgi:hypothetical protein
LNSTGAKGLEGDTTGTFVAVTGAGGGNEYFGSCGEAVSRRVPKRGRSIGFAVRIPFAEEASGAKGLFTEPRLKGEGV